MTGKLCYKCHKVVVGPPEKISFPYFNFTVSVLKDGISCVYCAKKGWFEAFKEVEKFFALSGEQPEFNWQRYIDCQINERRKKALAVAVSFGILSYIATGNWEIVREDFVNLNPDSFGGKIFFVHFEDALAFAELEYANTSYAWEIRRIGEVVSRKVALIMAQTI